MLGRVLFALVCLIIAAGLLLPMYPSEVVRSGVVAADGALLGADGAGSGCQGCAPAASRGCAGACACAHALPATMARPEACLSLTVYLIVRPLPAGRSSAPQPLPPKLPTI